MRKPGCSLFAIIALASGAQPLMVKGIYTALQGSSPSNLLAIGNKLYFTTRDNLNIYGSSNLNESDGICGTKLYRGNLFYKSIGNNGISAQKFIKQ